MTRSGRPSKMPSEIGLEPRRSFGNDELFRMFAQAIGRRTFVLINRIGLETVESGDENEVRTSRLLAFTSPASPFEHLLSFTLRSALELSRAPHQSPRQVFGASAALWRTEGTKFIPADSMCLEVDEFVVAHTSLEAAGDASLAAWSNVKRFESVLNVAENILASKPLHPTVGNYPVEQRLGSVVDLNL